MREYALSPTTTEKALDARKGSCEKWLEAEKESRRTNGDVA